MTLCLSMIGFHIEHVSSDCVGEPSKPPPIQSPIFSLEEDLWRIRLIDFPGSTFQLPHELHWLI